MACGHVAADRAGAVGLLVRAQPTTPSADVAHVDERRPHKPEEGGSSPPVSTNQRTIAGEMTQPDWIRSRQSG